MFKLLILLYFSLILTSQLALSTKKNDLEEVFTGLDIDDDDDDDDLFDLNYDDEDEEPEEEQSFDNSLELLDLTVDGNKLSISFSQFQTALTSSGYPAPTNTQYSAFISQLNSNVGISNLREAAMFLAQVIWESGGLKYKEEVICVQNGCPGFYDKSKYDGKTYYGRGYFFLTWSANYEAASKYLFNDDRLLRDPDMVVRDENVSWSTAFWFWKVNVSPDPGVIKGQFGSSTNRINGAIECKRGPNDKALRRFEIYKKVLIAFGVTDKPIESGCYN